MKNRRGADKFFALTGRKRATATKYRRFRRAVEP
jgi:hypothetical protein